MGHHDVCEAERAIESFDRMIRLSPLDPLRVGVRIPIYSGRVFRREAGRRSDLKPATIPK